MNLDKTALSEITLKIFEKIRQNIPFITYDQPLTPYIEKIYQLITSGSLFEDILNLWDYSL